MPHTGFLLFATYIQHVTTVHGKNAAPWSWLDGRLGYMTSEAADRSKQAHAVRKSAVSDSAPTAAPVR